MFDRSVRLELLTIAYARLSYARHILANANKSEFADRMYIRALREEVAAKAAHLETIRRLR